MRDGAVYLGEERGPSGSCSWTVAYPTGNNLRALSQITQKHTFQETWQSQWRERFQTRNFKCLETYENVLTLSNRGIHIKPAITHLLFSVWPRTLNTLGKSAAIGLCRKALGFWGTVFLCSSGFPETPYTSKDSLDCEFSLPLLLDSTI